MDWNGNYPIMSGSNSGELNTELLQTWLYWAGAKLIAMPTGKIKPAEPRALWPDYAVDPWQVLEFRAQHRIRVPAPSKDEIPIMEEILLFPNYCSLVLRRRVLHLRLLVNPTSGRPINSWDKVAKRINTSVERSKRLHSAGLQEVLFKLPESKSEAVARFFAGISVF
jgi:hypothetical protein